MAIILNGTTGTVEASWTTATRPASPVAGQMGFNTTISAMETYTGSAWVTSDLPAPGTTGNVLTSNGTSWTSAAAAAFDAGTRMAFQQTAAPTGWTKDTTAALNDSIFRIVVGTASSGGATAFSSWAAVTSTSSYTLASADIPSHTHTYTTVSTTGSASGKGTSYYRATTSATTDGGTGGGGGHSHGVSSQNLKYYDFIIASKN
jgi:hypothetical protein